MLWSSQMLIPSLISSRLRSLRVPETDTISHLSNGTTAASLRSGFSYFPRSILLDKCQCISLCTTHSKICRQGYLLSSPLDRIREMSDDMFRTRHTILKSPTCSGGWTLWTTSGLTSHTRLLWILSFITILTASLRRRIGPSTALQSKWRMMASLSNSTHASTTTQTVAQNLKHALSLISNSTFKR